MDLAGSSHVDPGTVPDVETVLADSLKLSRERAAVARALPLAFWKSRERLDLDRLRREAERRGQSRTLAFFLDLTARLSGEAMFDREAAKLRVHVPEGPVQFLLAHHRARAQAGRDAHARGREEVGVLHEHGDGQLRVDVQEGCALRSHPA